jgi:hypothetical protein
MQSLTYSNLVFKSRGETKTLKHPINEELLMVLSATCVLSDGNLLCLLATSYVPLVPVYVKSPVTIRLSTSFKNSRDGGPSGKALLSMRNQLDISTRMPFRLSATHEVLVDSPQNPAILLPL